MSGLMRGKRLVWVLCGRGWKATSHFGEYSVYATVHGIHWELTIGDGAHYIIVADGDCSETELAQVACQEDHDSRVMASVEVVPFEWQDISGRKQCANGRWLMFVGPWEGTWKWCVLLCESLVKHGFEQDRDAAVTAAETFVRQLVMGVPK